MQVRHPSLLLDGIPWTWIEDWKNYHEQDPWGEYRADWRAIARNMIDKGIDCITGIAPNQTFPYFDEKHDPEALYKLLRKQAAERREKDGRGNSSNT